MNKQQTMKKKMFMWLPMLLLAAVCVGFASCGDDDDDIVNPIPVIPDTGNMAYKTCPNTQHPHWIDLGLPSGTLWRCCNLGASKPEDNGNLYRFGQASSAPTYDQMVELFDKCRYEYVNQSNVDGGRFTGPNGGKIFLPSNVFSRSSTRFWSSTPYDARDAYALSVGLGAAYYGVDWYERTEEFYVRPVRKK